GCTPGVGDCLPTPQQCATGAYNGHYTKADPAALPDPTTIDPNDPGATTGPAEERVADCLGGGGHIVHYIGGNLNVPCGDIIDDDRVTAGFWTDPNFCPVEANHHTGSAHGRRYQRPVQGRGVVVSGSAAASRVGADMLAKGGNAVDAAVAAVFTA